MTTLSDGVRVGFATRRRSARQHYPRTEIVWMDFVPATLDRDGICAAQTLGAAGNLLLNGALVTGGVASTMDTGSYGRCVGVFSAADLSAVTFTVRGHDFYGEPVSENIAGPNATTTAGLKVFRRVTSVGASAAVGSNVEVGTIDKFGVPMRLLDLTRVVRVGWAATLAANAATIAVGVTTDPATATTGDVRGTVIPAGSAADGARRLSFAMIPDLTNSLTQYGVRQFASGLE